MLAYEEAIVLNVSFPHAHAPFVDIRHQTSRISAKRQET
jgi:hypothetical protein